MPIRASILFLIVVLATAACGGLSPAAIGAVNSIPTPSPSPSSAPIMTVSPTALPTATPSPTPPPTATTTPTATSTPQATVTPTASPTSTPSPTPTSTPTPTPDPATLVNGVPVADFIVMPPETQENVRRIFARGQELGRHPRRFSKLGDSISLTSHYLARFDQRRYNLGIYDGLQPAIDYYRGSFHRFGLATRIGLLAWTLFRPGEADPVQCNPNEHMVACELRRHNPSVLLIRLGTNDMARGDAFERAMRHAIQYSIDNGIIPVIITKSDRFEGDNRHNETMRALAAEYAVPLWDFDLLAGTLPDRGLGSDGVHLTSYAVNDYTDPATLTFGYPLSDLSGLMMLDAIRRTVEEGGG